MNSTLVTGAAGFLGRQLVRSLLADGLHVVGVDNFVTSDAGDLTSLLDNAAFAFEELDVVDHAFRRFVAGRRLDAVYHLACPTGVPNLGPLALEMLRTSYEGSMAAVEIARENAAPVLLASTAEVYGNPDVSPQSEEYTGNVATLGPRNGYEEGKRVAETIFSIYARRYGVQATIVRIFNTYGPGMSLTDTRVVPAFVTAALTGKPLIVQGNGTQTRCHCYVNDTVAGLRSAMSRGCGGRAYNLGSQTQTTVRDLAETVIRLAGSTSTLSFIDRPAHDHDGRLPDTTRAATELGWQPAVGLEAGLRQTIQDVGERLNASRRLRTARRIGGSREKKDGNDDDRRATRSAADAYRCEVSPCIAGSDDDRRATR